MTTRQRCIGLRRCLTMCPTPTAIILGNVDTLNLCPLAARKKLHNFWESQGELTHGNRFSNRWRRSERHVVDERVDQRREQENHSGKLYRLSSGFLDEVG